MFLSRLNSWRHSSTWKINMDFPLSTSKKCNRVFLVMPHSMHQTRFPFWAVIGQHDASTDHVTKMKDVHWLESQIFNTLLHYRLIISLFELPMGQIFDKNTRKLKFILYLTKQHFLMKVTEHKDEAVGRWWSHGVMKMICLAWNWRSW